MKKHIILSIIIIAIIFSVACYVFYYIGYKQGGAGNDYLSTETSNESGYSSNNTNNAESELVGKWVHEIGRTYDGDTEFFGDGTFVGGSWMRSGQWIILGDGRVKMTPAMEPNRVEFWTFKQENGEWVLNAWSSRLQKEY